MMKKSFSLVSTEFKILSIIITLFMVGLTIVFIVFQPLWYAIIFSALVSTVCSFATILCYRNKIVVDNENSQLIVYNIKSKRIDLHNLRCIEVDTNNSTNEKKYCFIVFKLSDGSIYKIAGYTAIVKHKSVSYTQKIVNELIKYLNK